MLFTCSEDFFEQTSKISRLSREEEKEYGKKMQNGDEEAKQALINSYLPVVAAIIKRYTADTPSLELIYRSIKTLEEMISKYDFQQDNVFMNALSSNLRRVITKYMIDSDTKS